MSIWNLLRSQRPTDTGVPYSTTTGFDLMGSNYDLTVPYRVKFKKHYIPTNDTKHYCRRSRSSDGHKREAALKELVRHDLSVEDAAYVLVALGDYVIQVSTLPLQATEKTKKQMRRIVKDNPRYVVYLDAVTISYWNEYYKYIYTSYQDYPPYKFLQSLK